MSNRQRILVCGAMMNSALRLTGVLFAGLLLANGLARRRHRMARVAAPERIEKPRLIAVPGMKDVWEEVGLGSITYCDVSGGKTKVYPLYEYQPDSAAMAAYIADTRTRSGRTFRDDLVHLIQGLRGQ